LLAAAGAIAAGCAGVLADLLPASPSPSRSNTSGGEGGGGGVRATGRKGGGIVAVGPALGAATTATAGWAYEGRGPVVRAAIGATRPGLSRMAVRGGAKTGRPAGLTASTGRGGVLWGSGDEEAGEGERASARVLVEGPAVGMKKRGSGGGGGGGGGRGEGDVDGVRYSKTASRGTGQSSERRRVAVRGPS